MAADRAHPAISRFTDMMSKVIVGNEAAIRLALTAFLTGGHILIEDVPGVGKTLLARTFARCLGLQFPQGPIHSGLASVRHNRDQRV